MSTDQSVLVIEAGRTERHYWRDILVRYKPTVIGCAWALIRPFLTMAVSVFVFSKLAKLHSEGMSYPTLVFAALLPLQFFFNAFTETGNSLISNANLILKVYFPCLVIRASAVIVSFVDYLASAHEFVN